MHEAERSSVPSNPHPPPSVPLTPPDHRPAAFWRSLPTQELMESSSSFMAGIFYKLPLFCFPAHGDPLQPLPLWKGTHDGIILRIAERHGSLLNFLLTAAAPEHHNRSLSEESSETGWYFVRGRSRLPCTPGCRLHCRLFALCAPPHAALSSCFTSS